MNTFIKTGFFVEKLMSSVFNAAEYANKANNYNAAKLLKVASSINPGRVANVASKIPSFKGWDNYTSAFIIDHVYGLDYLITVQPSGERIAFDLTCNSDAIDSKAKKLVAFKPLWEAIGISRVVVLHVTFPEGQDQGLAFLDMDSCVDALMEVIYDCIESKETVVKATLNLINK